MVKLSSNSDTDNIDTKYDKRDWIDIIDDKKYNRRDQIGEIQANKIYLEDLETDETYQIESATIFNRIDN